MPSPVGHMIAGYAVYAMMGRQPARTSSYILSGALLSAVMADFDFLPGIILGTPGRFHHGPSHSLGAVFCYALGIWMTLRCCRSMQATRLTLLFAGAYGSHLLLDFLAVDTGPPFGIPLFWPISDAYYLSPVSLFMDIRRLDRGAAAFLLSGFSAHNLLAVAWEMTLLVPLACWSNNLAQRAGHRWRWPRSCEPLLSSSPAIDPPSKDTAL